MLQNRVHILSVSLLICFNALAINTSAPKNLEFLSTANVSCSVQDLRGAIWLNSNRGFYRYNGQSAEYFNTQMGQTSLLCDSKGRIYGLDQDHVTIFDSNNLLKNTIIIGDETNLNSAAIAVDDTVLFIGLRNKLYKVAGFQYYPVKTFNDDITICSMCIDSDGRLLIGTNRKGLITTKGETILKNTGYIRTIKSSEDGAILVGTQSHGLYILHNNNAENIGRGTLYDIRSVIEMDNGDYLIGTADGLYIYNSSGVLTKEKIDGATSCPICSINKDTDGNIWISTYYNGLILSEKNSGNYRRLDTDKEIQNIKGLTRDTQGNVFMAADGGSIWMGNAGTGDFHRINNTEGYKFQCAMYDEASSTLWASEYHGKVMSINPYYGITNTYDVGKTNASQNENILSIKRSNGKFYMAGIDGIYIFNPSEETEAVNMVSGLNNRVFDLAFDSNGTIWAVGHGLYRIDNDNATKVEIGGPDWSDESTIADIEIDGDGRMWLAYFRRGVICKEGDNVHIFNRQKCGLIDDFCFNVIPLGSGKALVSTGREISMISIDGTTLRFTTNKTNRLLKLEDGTVFAVGNDGIKLINPAKIQEGKNHKISIDKFSVNGKRFNGSILAPEQTSFSFEVTTFDYTETEARSYFCKLKGLEENWKEFDIKHPVSYMNMKPGKYTFEVESRTYSSETIASDSFNFRIKPHWWATTQAHILFILIALTIIGLIIYFLNTKNRLTEEIRIKEKENLDKTMFFINLSYQLRTPLNLAIGNLEHFFNKYGARTAGITSIEDVYNKAKEMRNLISEYVDTRNDQIEDKGLKPIAKDAKFLNAAIGVVERNLFSTDLNVGLLCEELNMGKTNLTKRIEEASGMTPRAFIEDIKLKHAAQMLLDGTYRVAEIADLFNFSSPKHFSQRFRLHYGCTPKEYSKKEGMATT